MQKGSTINVIGTQVFLLGLANGASIVHANKYDAFSHIHYARIQSTRKLSNDGYVYIKIKK